MHGGYFDNVFLQSLPNDSLEAAVYLFGEFKRFHIEVGKETAKTDVRSRTPFHDDYIDALALFRAFAEARSLKFDMPGLGSDKDVNISCIVQCITAHGLVWDAELSKRSSSSLFAERKDHYSAIFTATQVYEFSEEELAKIQELATELVELISSSNLLFGDHKRRLLRRLEAMQGEIHRNTCDIDRFWGFLAEAGIVARKFGEDVKPIVERAFELSTIVIGAIMKKEGVTALPEITRLLGS